MVLPEVIAMLTVPLILTSHLMAVVAEEVEMVN
jgi:hypothetical protein